MFLLNMSLEISNIYSLLLYRYLFWYFLGGGRGEGGVLIFRLIAWGVLKICMDLGGGYKKTSRWKKNPLPPPVAYIMNAALDLVMKFLINENQLKVGGSDLNEIK